MSMMEGTIAWDERRAAMWSTMTGTAEGPIPTRQPTLLVGRRRVPPKLWGWWSMETPFFFVCREEKIVGLVEYPHFFFEACLEIHRAGETGDVSIAGLVYCDDRVKQNFPGGVGGHGVTIFIATKSYGRWLGLRQ